MKKRLNIKYLEHMDQMNSLLCIRKALWDRILSKERSLLLANKGFDAELFELDIISIWCPEFKDGFRFNP